MAKEIKIPWKPQPRQLTFLRACGLAHPFEGGAPRPSDADIIVYGGSAGGGKSDGLLTVAQIGGLSYPGIMIGYFRRQFPQLEGPGAAIMRSQKLMSSWAKYNGSNHRWTMPTGSVLQFCHCKNEDDVYDYQSQMFDILLFDEGTQFTEFIIRYLLTRNRSTTNNNPEFTPFCAIATNPGGVGHAFIKQQFIDIGPPEQVHNYEIEGTVERHLFIPAKLSDNQILEKRDPSYRRKLESQPEVLRRQLLDGDWDVFSGQYYSEFRRNIHVVEPFQIPDWWKRFRALDYGLDMTACYWIASSPDGRCFVYRELYEKDLNLTQAAKRILSLTRGDEHISYTVASPDLWNRRQETGYSGQEIMAKAGLKGLIRADNARVQGWRTLREFLAPYTDEQNVTVARIAIFENCINLIRCIPLLQHDEHNPEDVSDKNHEISHSVEACRYFCMSRPAISVSKDELRERRAKRRKGTAPVISRLTGY